MCMQNAPQKECFIFTSETRAFVEISWARATEKIPLSSIIKHIHTDEFSVILLCVNFFKSQEYLLLLILDFISKEKMPSASK